MDRESTLVCDNCGGNLEVDSNKRLARCPFCGTCFSVSGLLGESDDLKIERIRGDIELGRQNVELGRQNIEAQRLKLEEMEALRNDPEKRAKAFKKGGISKVTMIFAVISILTSVLAFVPNTPFHSVKVGIVAAIQALFYLVTFFLGMQVIPQKGKNLHILTFVLGGLLIIPFSVSCISCVSDGTGISEEKDETFSWDEIVLSDKIPSLESENGHIWDNTKDRLQLNVYNIPIKQYYSFVESCKTMGYTIESTEGEEEYLAFNQERYKLSLRYSILHDGEVDIEINAPKKLSEFVFPDSALAKLIPVPKSNIGEIAVDSESRLLIYVGQMPKESYNAYVDECAEKGFTIDFEKSENSYNAKNADGFKLYVTYNGNENVEISLYAPEKSVPQSPESIESSSGVSSSSENSNSPSESVANEPEPTFSIETSMRAAVVALTNGYANDVFDETGNDYDTSKLHNYSDLSGYHLNVISKGEWTTKSENSRHVENLVLEDSVFGGKITAALDVTFDGTNYIVSGISGKYGNNDLSLLEAEPDSFKNNYLVIKPEMIADDRSASSVIATSKYDKYDYRKIFEQYGKEKYPYGFKCHWILDLRAEEKWSNNSYYFKVGVTITNMYGVKLDTVAEAVIRLDGDDFYVDSFYVS